MTARTVHTAHGTFHFPAGGGHTLAFAALAVAAGGCKTRGRATDAEILADGARVGGFVLTDLVADLATAV